MTPQWKIISLRIEFGVVITVAAADSDDDADDDEKQVRSKPHVLFLPSQHSTFKVLTMRLDDEDDDYDDHGQWLACEVDDVSIYSTMYFIWLETINNHHENVPRPRLWQPQARSDTTMQ